MRYEKKNVGGQMMNTKDNGKRWFTAADVLITLLVLALTAGTLVLFLFPHEEESTAVTVEATMVIHLQETPVGITAGDKLFNGDAEIGTVSKVDKRSNNVIIKVSLSKDNGAYTLGGESVRVYGSFDLETKLRSASGVIESIVEKEA